MPRFHFHLRAGGMMHRDLDGTQCPDTVAARSHAATVATELMQHSDRRTRHWSMLVEDERGEPSFELFFADVDPTLGCLPPELQGLTVQTCRRLGALTDALCAARATRIQSRILLARAQQQPRLVYAKGE
jgi:hypothetical protein